MTEANSWRFQCCQRAQNAIADNARCTVLVVVKPRRGRRFPLYTVTVNDAQGRLLGSCRHEMDPFDNTALSEVWKLLALALMR